MKKSVILDAAPSDLPARDRLRRIREAGFDGVELPIGEDGEFSVASSEEQVRAFGRMVREAGLEVSGLLAGLCWKYPLTSDNPQTRKKAEYLLDRSIQMCAWAGTDALLVVPGVVQADWAEPGIVSYEDVWNRSADALSRLLKTAEREGVYLCVENVWNKFLLSPMEMRLFVDGLSSSWAAVYLDVGNIIPYGYPEQWIRILGSRIRRIHLKDFKTLGLGVGAFVGLLEGDVNWAEVMRALGEINYDGWLTAEYWPYRHCPQTLLRHLAASMDAILLLSRTGAVQP